MITELEKMYATWEEELSDADFIEDFDDDITTEYYATSFQAVPFVRASAEDRSTLDDQVDKLLESTNEVIKQNGW